MPHTYAQNVIHVVFSTEGRLKLIPKELQPRMWAYVIGICKNQGIYVHAIGGMSDHMHLLLQFPPALALAEGVRAIKANSSRWANEQGHKFAWQEGYAAFSVSASLIPTVIRYIQTQEIHHKRRTFDSELIVLLKKHGVEFDPPYVFG